MRMVDHIEQKLTAAFQPGRLIVRDDSHHHEGHAGHRPGGQSHFYVEIQADAFAGLSRVKQHQAIYAVLANEMQGPIHALQLNVSF